MSIHLIVGLALLFACLALVVYTGWNYMHAPSSTTTIDATTKVVTQVPATWIDKASYAYKQSEALLVQAMSALCVLLINGILQLAEWANTPEFRDVLQTYMTPTNVSLVIFGILAASTWARLRGNFFMRSNSPLPANADVMQDSYAPERVSPKAE